MLVQSPRLHWPSTIGLLMTSSTGSTPVISTSSIWFKIWRLIGDVDFWWSGVSSKVITGVVNTSKTCMVLEIKITSWPILIWCLVKGTLIDMNSKNSNLLSNMANEGLTSSTCSLLDFSLPSTSWVIIVVNKTCMVEVWTTKGMISKLVPPLSRLNGLITCCTTNVVVGIMLLVPISTYIKLGVCT